MDLWKLNSLAVEASEDVLISFSEGCLEHLAGSLDGIRFRWIAYRNRMPYGCHMDGIAPYGIAAYGIHMAYAPHMIIVAVTWTAIGQCTRRHCTVTAISVWVTTNSINGNGEDMASRDAHSSTSRIVHGIKTTTGPMTGPIEGRTATLDRRRQTAAQCQNWQPGPESFQKSDSHQSFCALQTLHGTDPFIQ